mmetsp:Transcript_102217/g.218850  ORF Transcript_102217/g.218850 Transcript_102217/m.218850 type:complete len:253 (-) Transcript_102217:45-803(-)
MAVAAECQDVVLGWMVTAPKGAPEPPPGEVLHDIGEARMEMRRRAAALGSGGRLFVGLDGATWGVVSTLRCASGLGLFRGFCALEGLEDGKDYLALGAQGAAAELVLVKEAVFCSFLCRLWAREQLGSAVRPLLVAGEACPFDASGSVHLTSDEAAAEHYLELLLGRGRKDLCPQAGQYLQGVARDMTLRQQPYLSAVLEGRCKLQGDSSVLAILERLDGGSADIPRDYQEDLALAVAAKALELVSVLGLDL